MEFFVRFVASAEAAQKDMERGFSFSDYILFDSPEDVLEHFGIEDADSIEIAQDNGECAGQWGIALNGLCGFGPFASTDEAEAYAYEHRGYNGVEWPAAAIFTGSYVSDNRVWDGDCFRPASIAKIVSCKS